MSQKGQLAILSIAQMVTKDLFLNVSELVILIMFNFRSLNVSCTWHISIHTLVTSKTAIPTGEQLKNTESQTFYICVTGNKRVRA